MRVKDSFVTFLMKQLTHKKVNKRDFVRNDYKHLANNPII